MARILVAEDEQDVRENLVDLLACEGYEVEAAADGRQCVEKALRNPPDLIICDVVMPQLNGLEVIQRLRTDLTTSDLPFIFLTARATREDQRAGMDRGADDYLVKPFAAEELLQAIQVRLERAKVHRDRFNSMAQSLASTLESKLMGEALTHVRGLREFSESLAQFYPSMGRSHIFQVANDIQDHSLRLQQLVEDFVIRTCIQAGSVESVLQHVGTALPTFGSDNISTCLLRTAGHWARATDLELVEAGSEPFESNMFQTKVCTLLTESVLWATAPGVKIRVRVTAETEKICVTWEWDNPEKHAQNGDHQGLISAQSKVRYAESIAHLLHGTISSDFINCHMKYEA